MSPSEPGFDVARPRSLEGHRVAMLHESVARGDSRVERQLEELVAHGATVTVWCAGPEPRQIGSTDPFDPAIEFRHRVAAGLGAASRPVVASDEQVAEHQRWASGEISEWRPTIIAHHSPATLPFGMRLSGDLDVPLVSDFNDMPPESPARSLPWPLRRRPSRFYPTRATDVELRSLYPLAASRMTVAPGLARELGRRYRVPEPHIVMNVPRSVGSAVSPSGGRTETVRDKVGLADHDRLMVYVGNVNARRNVEGLLETLVVSPDWHLAIVGSAEWRLEKFGLWERVPAPVRQRIHVIERQPDTSLPSFLSTADCGVFIPHGVNFNIYHCAPNKYFAMALAGIPLVVSDLPFLAGEVRRLGIGAVVRSTEPVVVRAALDRAVAMKDQVRNARPRVAREYAWERQAEQLILAYRESVGLR